MRDRFRPDPVKEKVKIVKIRIRYLFIGAMSS
jgi:hypothetical protein